MGLVNVSKSLLAMIAPAAALPATTASPDQPANNDEAPGGKFPQAQDLSWAVPSGFRLIVLALLWFLRTIWLSIRGCLGYLRHHPVHALINAVLVVLLAVMVATGSEIHKQMILGQISDQSIDRIIQASQFTRDFDAAAANRDGAREFQKVGAPDWVQRESIRAILYHARKFGLSIEDQAVLLATAEIESGFNPMARATSSSACGIFQFVQRTGALYGLSTAACMNPWINARSQIDHYLSNFEQRVRKEVANLSGAERVLRTFELSYYLHHDGPASTNPTNDLKALVLTGSHFLFKVYHVLQEEADSEQHAPSFTQIFSEKLWGMVDRIATFFEYSALPTLGVFRRVAKDTTGAPA